MSGSGQIMTIYGSPLPASLTVLLSGHYYVTENPRGGESPRTIGDKLVDKMLTRRSTFRLRELKRKRREI